jgi:hypothetical protein
MKGYLLTTRVEGPALWAMPRHEAQWYFTFWAGDLQAGYRLNLCCEKLYLAGDLEGAAVLWNACEYLRDRAAHLAEAQRRGMETARR